MNLGTTGIAIVIGFSILLIAIVLFISRKAKSSEQFFVGNRQFGLWTGAFSSAAAWIWAPALFVSSQVAYTKGLPGVFWFIIPNTLALILFAFLAKKVRSVMEQGYTLPEYIKQRLGTNNQFLYTVVMFIYQCYAVIVQLLGSLLLLNFLTGLSKPLLITILAVVFLIIASFRGIRSSVIADMLKVVMMLSVVLLVAPIVISRSGGGGTLLGGLGGAKGTFTNLLNPMIAWTYGIPTAISLLAGITIEQQQWQRAFSIKKKNISHSFLLASIIFFVVPLALSLLGFVASNPSLGISVSDPQLSGIGAIAHFLPSIGVIMFVLMILFGLIAAGSSALCAISTLTTNDIYKQYINKSASEKQQITLARITMLIVLVIGVSVALIPNISILYLQLLTGAFKATLFVPTILALYWTKLSSKASFWSILIGLVTGAPLFIYGTIIGNPSLSTWGSIAPLIISAIVCYIGSVAKKSKA